MTIKLFCVPYAGGSSALYNNWIKQLAPRIECIPIELSGRGLRFIEPLYTSIEEAVDDVYTKIAAQLDSSPFAIFGHSMGAVIGFEVTHRICQVGRIPRHLFVSGRNAPHCSITSRPIHLLSDSEFMQELVEMGGTDKTVLEHEELVDLFLPILRSDFGISHSYKFVKKKSKLSCDISVFYGNLEQMSFEDGMAWKEHSEGMCRVFKFSGNHFFIKSQEKEVLNCVRKLLTGGMAI
ncbi:thioesterase II family protein [Alicyclobacillus fodiniaquatilis]|uniref:Thioesterase II family protein n=1 Tax=Alicyclobacillus fodiniaquatilis TaxID=1661150 RepID=A0ABW4JIX2_9BACL